MDANYPKLCTPRLWGTVKRQTKMVMLAGRCGVTNSIDVAILGLEFIRFTEEKGKMAIAASPSTQ